jgi:hypothetical protein
MGGIINTILAGAAAAGDSLGGSIQQQLDTMNREQLMEKQATIQAAHDHDLANLTAQKQKDIFDYQEAQKNKGMNSLKNYLQNANMPVPVEAAPVTALTQDSAPNMSYANDGENTLPAGVVDTTQAPNSGTGIQGNINQLKPLIAQAQANLASPTATPEQKANAQGILDQIQQQIQEQKQVNADAVEGQTRARTPDEVTDAATNYAKMNDPQAYKAAIDAGLIDPKYDLQMAIYDKRAESEDKKRQAAADAQDKKLAAMREIQEMKENAAANKGKMSPDQIESTAQSIAKYNRTPPSQFVATRGSWPDVMERVLEIEPEYDDTFYGSKKKTMGSFAVGQEGRSVKSLNVGMDHLDSLSTAAKALNNSDARGWNQATNAITSWFGSTPPKDFDAIKHIVASEITKAIVGSAGALADREATEKTIDKANSPAQLQSVIDQYKDLMGAQLMGLRDQYRANTKLNDFDNKYLSTKSKALLAPLLSNDTPASQAKTNTAQPAPSGGIKFLGFEGQ